MHDSLVAFLVSHVTHTTIFGPELDVRKRGYVMLLSLRGRVQRGMEKERTIDRSILIKSIYEYNLTIRTLVKVVLLLG